MEKCCNLESESTNLFEILRRQVLYVFKRRADCYEDEESESEGETI
jgi:hypothetical protein